MSEILRLEPVRRREVNESIVSLLRDWLEKAERGDLRAVTICSIGQDGTAEVGASECECFHAMLGGLAMLQFAMMKKHDEAT